MRVLTFSSMGLAFGDGFLLPSPLPALPAITRYVAPETGDDANDGLTAETAWRRMPGDTLATGGAAAYTPAPGDHIAARGGERYRGRVQFKSSGTPEAPIVYSGNAWGSGRCIYDGADPVSVRLPTSQEDAGGSALWNHPDMRVVEWTADGRPTVLHDAFGLLPLSQFPRPVDPYQPDDIHASADVTVRVSGALIKSDMQIDDAVIAEAVTGEEMRAVVCVWAGASTTYECPIVSLVGTLLQLGGPTLDTYLPTTKVYIRNTVKHVTLPGDCCVLGDGKAILLTRGSLMVRRSHNPGDSSLNWRTMRLNARNNLHIRGFDCTGHADTIVISNGDGSSTGVKVFDNIFRDMWGGGGVSATFTTDMEIFQNRFVRLPMSNAINNNGDNTLIEYNVVHQVGGNARTAIARSSSRAGPTIRYNIISKVNGSHPNGTSIYGDDVGVRIYRNCYWGIERPLVIQGDNWPDQDHDLRVEENVFVARNTPETSTGYGFRFNDAGNKRGQTYRRNLAIGKTRGMAFVAQSADVTVDTNWISGGFSLPTGSPNRTDTWTVTGNEPIAADYLETSGALLDADRINVLRPDGTRLALDLRGVGA